MIMPRGVRSVGEGKECLLNRLQPQLRQNRGMLLSRWGEVLLETGFVNVEGVAIQGRRVVRSLRVFRRREKVRKGGLAHL